jgi:hypothetical protein
MVSKADAQASPPLPPPTNAEADGAGPGVPLVLAEPVPEALIEALAAQPPHPAAPAGVHRGALLAEHARHARVNVNVRQVRRQRPVAP